MAGSCRVILMAANAPFRWSGPRFCQSRTATTFLALTILMANSKCTSTAGSDTQPVFASWQGLRSRFSLWLKRSRKSMGSSDPESPNIDGPLMLSRRVSKMTFDAIEPCSSLRENFSCFDNRLPTSQVVHICSTANVHSHPLLTLNLNA